MFQVVEKKKDIDSPEELRALWEIAYGEPRRPARKRRAALQALGKNYVRIVEQVVGAMAEAGKLPAAIVGGEGKARDGGTAVVIDLRNEMFAHAHEIAATAAPRWNQRASLSTFIHSSVRREITKWLGLGNYQERSGAVGPVDLHERAPLWRQTTMGTTRYGSGEFSPAPTPSKADREHDPVWLGEERDGAHDGAHGDMGETGGTWKATLKLKSPLGGKFADPDIPEFADPDHVDTRAPLSDALANGSINAPFAAEGLGRTEAGDVPSMGGAAGLERERQAIEKEVALERLSPELRRIFERVSEIREQDDVGPEEALEKMVKEHRAPLHRRYRTQYRRDYAAACRDLGRALANLFPDERALVEARLSARLSALGRGNFSGFMGPPGIVDEQTEPTRGALIVKVPPRPQAREVPRLSTEERRQLGEHVSLFDFKGSNSAHVGRGKLVAYDALAECQKIVREMGREDFRTFTFEYGFFPLVDDERTPEQGPSISGEEAIDQIERDRSQARSYARRGGVFPGAMSVTLSAWENWLRRNARAVWAVRVIYKNNWDWESWLPPEAAAA